MLPLPLLLLLIALGLALIWFSRFQKSGKSPRYRGLAGAAVTQPATGR